MEYDVATKYPNGVAGMLRKLDEKDLTLELENGDVLDDVPHVCMASFDGPLAYVPPDLAGDVPSDLADDAPSDVRNQPLRVHWPVVPPQQRRT